MMPPEGALQLWTTYLLLYSDSSFVPQASRLLAEAATQTRGLALAQANELDLAVTQADDLRKKLEALEKERQRSQTRRRVVFGIGLGLFIILLIAVA